MEPSFKEYRKLAREYAERSGRKIPFGMFGLTYTLEDLVAAFKNNPHWVENKNGKWKIVEKYFSGLRRIDE